MDIKTKFNPSTLLRAGEMSILLPVLLVFTFGYLGLMAYDFAAKSAFEVPAGVIENVLFNGRTGHF